MTNLILRINNNAADSSYAAQPTYYKDMDPTNDYFIFSAGSTVVADGLTIPSADEINRAATQFGVAAIEVAKYFLADVGSNILYQVKNAGSVNKRYVFCASFDGATASEPQLEAWDDTGMTTSSLQCLGQGTPANSWYSAVCTTSALPGASWTGTPLAGSGASNIIKLNNSGGVLTVATDLYFNFKVVVPGALTTPNQYTPILAVVYTTN